MNNLRSTRKPQPWVPLALALIVCAMPLAATPAWAQSPGQAQGQPPAPPQLDADLFPPDLVMRFQKEIGLTDKQSMAIVDAVRNMQSEMIEVQWNLSPELEGLRAMLSQPRIDEGEVRERLTRITSMENRAKELQVLLMVRVKNALTPEQQEQLRGLR